jgi:peptidoglycan hydrolase-like protein with peptidoglycan-binding domain
MDPMTIIGLIPTALRIADFMKRALSQGVSINAIGTVFQNEDIKKLFAMVGAYLFPKVRPELQPAAGAAVSYAPDYVMKVQNAANILLRLQPPLDVDGHYGPLTRDAVEKLQKKLGLEAVDGWVGDKSMAAIQAALLKQTDEAKTNIPTPGIPKPLPAAPAPA